MAEARDVTEHEHTGESVEELLLGAAPSLTRRDVAERAGVSLRLADELWRQLGFPRAADGDVAFVEADVEALRLASELTDLGVLTPESQAALVRTWGRAFARLADWQSTLLARVAERTAADDPATVLTRLTDEALPRVGHLQDYVWRRHLASATARLVGDEEGDARPTAVGFVDIVGYTSTSRNLDEAELVSWVEGFEDVASTTVTDLGGRVIKNIGDEVLFVADEAASACEIALSLAERGADEDDPFPRVRGGVAHGEVVTRLGDVFGETVNLAARITSAARPGAVLVDAGVHNRLCPDHADPDSGEATTDYLFRRVRRASVKDYSGLPVWSLRRR